MPLRKMIGLAGFLSFRMVSAANNEIWLPVSMMSSTGPFVTLDLIFQVKVESWSVIGVSVVVELWGRSACLVRSTRSSFPNMRCCYNPGKIHHPG